MGKTCIIQNYSKGTSAFLNYRPTLGIDYVSKNIELPNSHTVKAQIWDTAGQENYRSITVEYPPPHPATCAKPTELSSSSTSPAKRPSTLSTTGSTLSSKKPPQTRYKSSWSATRSIAPNKEQFRWEKPKHSPANTAFRTTKSRPMMSPS